MPKFLASRVAALVLLVLTTALPAFGEDFTIPFAGSATAAVSTGDRIFDHAGANNYSNNANGTLTLRAAGPITLTFTVFSTESSFDFVTVFDGSTTNDPILFGPQSGGPALPIVVTSTGGSMTIRFTSDGSILDQGIEAEVAVAHVGAPTMGEGALVLLGLALASLGMVILRRRTHTA